MADETKYIDHIVDFICDTKFEDLPALAVDRAKTRILDTIGVAVKGGTEEVGRLIKQFAEIHGGKPQVSIIGGQKTDCLTGAFVNGTLMHAIDFDDHFILSHPSICVVPAVLAVGELVGASGKDMILAYIVGLELYTKVQQCTSTEPWYRGFHATGIWGTISSVGAAAKLLGLNKQKTRMAVGIACSTFCGLKRNMGTHTKPYHCGRSVEGGVRAALLADIGYESHPEAFEGRFGYLHVFTSLPRYSYIEELGRVWDIVEHPTKIKPHPSCGGTHAAMNGMLELLRKYPEITEENVERVEVGMNQGGVDSLYYPNPTDIYQAKFSMHFVMALLLHCRRWGLALHTQKMVDDPAMRKLYPKVHFYVDKQLDQEIDRDMTDYHALVKVILKDGRVCETRSTLPDLELPEAERKFHECTDEVIGTERANRIVETVIALEKVDSCLKLTRQLLD